MKNYNLKYYQYIIYKPRGHTNVFKLLYLKSKINKKSLKNINV